MQLEGQIKNNELRGKVNQLWNYYFLLPESSRFLHKVATNLIEVIMFCS
jgi:hypothetical protein